jgi:hypothetical protein
MRALKICVLSMLYASIRIYEVGGMGHGHVDF